ncbi:hypothetical protein EV421DRAFT_2036343 [Armillaria borealis]|uniref:Uncharacterized protein n=1 Tax=Armillaria borealis TaxID=47425 RepID=A0AA39MPS6_9AGAR|nr:hypothetical protein EV421DRAFT_2036343 [Armillaria borealis]
MSLVDQAWELAGKLAKHASDLPQAPLSPGTRRAICSASYSMATSITRILRVTEPEGTYDEDDLPSTPPNEPVQDQLSPSRSVVVPSPSAVIAPQKVNVGKVCPPLNNCIYALNNLFSGQPAKTRLPRDIVAERIDNLLEAEHPPITLNEIKDIFMGTPIRDHQKREQKAFSRLICRYEPVSTKDLSDAFPLSLRPSEHTFARTFINLSKFHSEKDVYKRLLGRDQHLLSFSDSQPLSGLIYYVLHTMASLQWALDYSSQSAEDKTAYVEDLCAVMRKSDLDKAGNADARGAIFSAFKAQHRKHVTFRNSLIKLYQLVWHLYFLGPQPLRI